MVRRSSLRASDADREYVVERLRAAAAEGRLLAEELEHRLGLAFSARTYAELDVLVADLPRGAAVRTGRRPMPARLRPLPVVALLILLPMVLAIATVLVVAVAALFTAWAIAVTLAGLLLGPRARSAAAPWIVGCRVWRGRRSYRRLGGGVIPWL